MAVGNVKEQTVSTGNSQGDMRGKREMLSDAEAKRSRGQKWPETGVWSLSSENKNPPVCKGSS